MQKISYDDGKLLERQLYRKKIYDCYNYLFTFDGQYLVYERYTGESICYSVYDCNTRLSTNLFRRKAAMSKNQYGTLVEKILRSHFYALTPPQNPMELIRYIFSELMTKGGFAERENQIELSQEMYRGMEERKVAICEAEVGTGKTYAYLVAAVVFRIYDARERPITITTSSIELQKAIICNYIPKLSHILLDGKIIREPLSAVLRKGKEHYLCIRRYNDLLYALKSSGLERNMQFASKLVKLKLASKGIDLDTYPEMKKHIAARINIPKDCSENCPLSDSCPYMDFKRIANDTRTTFQVCNHNYYLANAMLESRNKKALMPSSPVVIIDEAHKLMDAALQIFDTRMDSAVIPKVCNMLLTVVKKSKQSQTYVQELCVQLQTATEELFCVLMGEQSDELEEARLLAVSLTDVALAKLSDMESLLAVANNMGSTSHGLHNSIGRLMSTISGFMENQTDIFWIEKEDNGDLILCRVSPELERSIYDTVWQSQSAKMLTSGTLSDGRGFSYFKRQVGADLLPLSKVSAITMNSPFDFKNHSRLYISSIVPFPDRDSEEYLQSISDEIAALVNATAGHTVILFTSYKLLSEIHERTASRISEYPIIKMDKSSKNTVNTFKKSRNGVLFAAGTLWEGVDCPGDVLSSVVIVNLPFPVPTPVLEYRKKSYEQLDDFIDEVIFPEMIIKLRQGIGRLIRNETDTGLVAILDYRAGKNGKYSDRISAALAQYPTIDNIGQITQWFREVKTDEYFKGARA